MSFVDQDDVMDLTERLVAHVFKKVKGVDVKLPLRRMPYNEAMDKYGSDKPDLRFEMPINDITDVFKNTEFTVLNILMFLFDAVLLAIVYPIFLVCSSLVVSSISK